ncbi:glucose/arabinose dehydrogenase [Bradyrhizobium ottawaense]
MTFSSIFAQFVALLGGVALQWRKLSGTVPAPAWGEKPAIPEAKPQGAIPTLKMPTARGWSEGQKPTVAPGLKVNAFATGLDHPRWIEVLPNGDVLIAEATQIAGAPRSVFHYAMQATMRRAAALGVSADRITLLRDTDGDGVAEQRGAFMENLSQPFGMALVGDTFYVGNTDGVMAFPYVGGADRITAPGKRLTTFKPSGHWTRSLLASPDGKKLYAGVGSLSNIAEMGMEVEEGRAAVYELDLVAGTHRIFGAGLRNPVGLAWEPNTGVLWTVVNERDGLGDETPPDYLTSVRDGGFYGWALLLLGQDGGRPRAAGSCDGRQGASTGLRARRPHRLARPVLDARRHAAGLPRRHGHRPARLVESQHAVRLQAGVHPVRERQAVRPRSRHPVGLPVPGREGILRPPGRCRDRPRQEITADGGRRRQRDLARHGRVKDHVPTHSVARCFFSSAITDSAVIRPVFGFSDGMFSMPIENRAESASTSMR